MKIFSAFFGMTGVTIFSFLMPFMIVKLFGVELYGQYSYYYSLILVIAVFGRLGFDNAIMFYYSTFKYRYINTVFVLAVFFIFFVIIILNIFSFFDNYYLFFLVLCISLSICLRDIFFSIYRIEDRIRDYYSSYILLFSVSQFIYIYILFIIYDSPSVLLVLGTLLISSVTFLFLLLYKNRSVLFNSITMLDKRFLSFSITSAFISISAVLMNRVDILILETYVSEFDLGIYQIFGQISLLIVFVMNVFNIVFAPKIASLYKSGKIEELIALYKSSTLILTAISFSILLILLFSYNIILSFFGIIDVPSNYFSVYVLKLFSQFAFVFLGSVGFMLTMTGKVKYQLFRLIFCMIFNILMNFLLIPNFGILGSSISLFFSLLISSFIGFFFVFKKIIKSY